MSAWIHMIQDDEADDGLRQVLKLAESPQGKVGNVMRVHSLRPSTMKGHVVLYQAALHDSDNTLPAWLQETISTYVSILNDCPYSVTNHWANARHLIADEERADKIESAMRAHRPEEVFDGRELALMRYAEKLTLNTGKMEESDVSSLRKEGLDDGQILEANQIVGYFNYANRLLNGLGVSAEGDLIGYYSDAPD